MICPSCSRENRDGARFCDECAASLATHEEEEDATPLSIDFDPSEGFVGRRRELAELESALEDALSGRGRLVMLAGEPGIGKTRTVRELASYAESRGALVLWSWCYEEEGAPPYWSWVQLIRSQVRQQDSKQLRLEMGPGAADIAEIVHEVREKLADLTPPPPTEPEQARFRLFDSITTFLKNAALSQPLMLVLEDLHWADRSSLLLLEFLARELGSSPLLVVGTYRDVEVSRRHPLAQTLGELIRETRFLRVQLPGLTPQEVAQLLRTTLGVSPSADLVEAIHRRTEGNPLFVSEVIRVLQRGGQEGDPESNAGIPEGIRDAISRRLGRLSEACSQVMTTASVIGREFDFKVLRALSANITEERLLQLVDEALEAHLIEESPGGMERYQFSHGLVQQTLAEELSTSRRVRLHGRIGEALEELYGDNVEAHASELAYHFCEAEAVLGTGKLVHFSLLAGDRALVAHAWEEALKHFQRGLESKEGQPTDVETAALLFGLGRAQLAAFERHQAPEAVSNLRRAFDYYVQVGDIASAVAVAQYPPNAWTGYNTGATELLARALALVPADSHTAGNLLCQYGMVIGKVEGDHPGAQQIFNRALEIARREGDVGLEGRILSSAADVDYLHLHYPESLEKSLKGIELFRKVSDPYHQLIAYRFAARTLIRFGELNRAQQYAGEMLTAAERLRDRTSLANALWLNASIALQTGDWTTARDYSDRGLAVSASQPILLFHRVLVEYESGDFSQGEVYLQQLMDVTRLQAPEPTLPRALSALVIPMAAYITGVKSQLDEAAAVAEAIVGSPSAVRRVATVAKAALGFLAVLRSNAASAREQIVALNSLRGTILTGNLLVDRLLGLLAQTAGNLDQAMAHFEDALAFCRQAGYRPELAWTCCDYAEALLVGAGSKPSPDRGAKAMTLLDEALAISSELGMPPLMERAVALQEHFGVRPGRAPEYPDDLTHREAEVLRLIALGKSNPEIAQELVVSIRTVTTHVSNIFSKINATNRAEAATYATRHGLV